MKRVESIARWANVLALAASMLTSAHSLAQPQEGAADDPPTRVARMSYATGDVSYSPAGNEDWLRANINRPIVTGDRLWADRNGRAELTVDNSTWWLGRETSVTVSNLDDRVLQLQVQQGTIDVRLRRLSAGDIVEIDTPNLAFSLTRPGRYRVDVDPQGGSTLVVVRDGAGEVYGENASYVVTSRQAYRFYGTDVSDNEFVDVPPVDAFERFALERDRRYASIVSARYVSPDVVGYEDLDTYGSWSAVSTYGNVWFPTRVSAEWAPYREGHWSWIDPWGWTWIDDEPWGFAPFHYGRWAHFDRGWGWVPGPRSVRAVYAPALVAFVGGAGFSIGVSAGPAIGWFPLGPRDVYVPSYRVSRDYFRQVNVSNTVVNVTNVTNIYNNPTSVSQVNYVNRTAPNAVTAVPPTVFAQAQNVGRAAVPISAAMIQRAEVRTLAPVAPARPALLGAAPAAQAKPPAAVMQRAVVAKVPPPPPPVPDAQKLPALARNPGQPLNRAELQTLRRSAPPAAVAPPAVKVVTQPKPPAGAAPPASAAPPARAAGPTGPRGPAGAAAPATPVPPAAAAQRPGAPPATGATPAVPGRPPVGLERRAAPPGAANAPQPPAGGAERRGGPPPGAATPAIPPQTPSVDRGATPAVPPVPRPPNARAERAPRGAEPATVQPVPEPRAAPQTPAGAGRGAPPGAEKGSRPAAPGGSPPEFQPPPGRGNGTRVEPQPRSQPRPEVARPAEAPQARPEPPRSPRAAPQARPEPPRPPQAQPPQARPEPPRQPQAQRVEPPRPPAPPGAEKGPPPRAPAKEDGKEKDKKDQNP